MKQKNSGKYIGIGTKTSRQFYKIFHNICESKGLNTYQVLQMMVDTFVRYTDDQHNLSRDIEMMMSVFEHMTGWCNAFNLADATAERSIEEAIYIMTAKGKRGARAVMVQRPFMGKTVETYNVQQILERVIEVLMPERYRRLRQLAVDNDCGSILEMLDMMIDAQTVEQLNADFRKPFEDARRHESGRAIEYGQKTKSVHHRTPDGEALRQQRIYFNEQDRQTADQEADNHTDFRPFGEEW